MRTPIVGNGHGIGLALTKRLLGDGNDVVGVSRREGAEVCLAHARHPPGRHRTRRRAIQYPRESDVESRGLGVLDRPVKPGDDDRAAV
jgi:NAD(P)-dependent dehydrogenase (short-subunit alcohol dehydrogenase family)